MLVEGIKTVLKGLVLGSKFYDGYVCFEGVSRQSSVERFLLILELLDDKVSANKSGNRYDEAYGDPFPNIV